MSPKQIHVGFIFGPKVENSDLIIREKVGHKLKNPTFDIRTMMTKIRKNTKMPIKFENGDE